MIDIDYRNLFFEALKSGINLFVGAGFSALKSPTGQCLPVGSVLAKELCAEFQLSSTYCDDLTRISTILKRKNKSKFYEYLRAKYTVQDYNALYKVVEKINIGSIITTNIDNLIPAVMDDSTKYYLNNLKYNGPTKKDGYALPYIPLHGDVLDDTSEMIFGKFEIADAANINRGPFAMMYAELLKRPTIFWGYSFSDGGVEALIGRLLEEGKQNIWVQVRNENEGDFYRELGCNVIVADTEQLLKEIDQELDEGYFPKQFNTGKTDDSFWSKLAVPSINKVESLPISDFYLQGKTHWYYALAEKAYPTKFITAVMDSSIANKNIIVVGFPLGGKTMLLMQIACKINKPVYFVTDLNEPKAKLIRNKAFQCGGNYILLIDDCAEDMIAYRILAECPMIQTIAVSDEYTYESSKHLLENISYKKLEIPDFDRNEAERVYSNIPNDLRNDEFVYKQKEEDKYSILELITSNVKNVISQEKVKAILEKIKKQNYEVFEIILLTAYLVRNRSALTTNTLVSYFNISDIDTIKNKIKLVRSCLTELNIELDADEIDQDYYSLRSSLFVKYTFDVALTSFTKDFSNIVKKFINEVHPSCIYKNNIFKRCAYDAHLFLKLFGNKADEVYKVLYRYDPSAYTLQQQALYKAYTNRFPEAFSDIDEAIHLMPSNFSIKNARAIILFEANKDKDTDDALQALKEAMAILEQCYTSDKRKIYHAQKYAEFALIFLKKHGEKGFVEKAYRWINELLESKESTSKKTRKLFAALKNEIFKNNQSTLHISVLKNKELNLQEGI